MHIYIYIYISGLEKSSVLPVLDQFLKLKTDLFLDKKLKNRSIKLCISQDFAIHRLTHCHLSELFTPNNPLLFVLILPNRDRSNISKTRKLDRPTLLTGYAGRAVIIANP